MEIRLSLPPKVFRHIQLHIDFTLFLLTNTLLCTYLPPEKPEKSTTELKLEELSL